MLFRSEHAVAEELEPLVIVRPVRPVGQRAGEGRGIGGRAAERRREPAPQFRIGKLAQNPSPIRRQRAAENHVQGSSQLALPSVEKKLTSALPSIRSIGT